MTNPDLEAAVERLEAMLLTGDAVGPLLIGVQDRQAIRTVLSALKTARRDALREAAGIVHERAADEALNVACMQALEVDNPTGKRHAGIMGNELLGLERAIRARAEGGE